MLLEDFGFQNTGGYFQASGAGFTGLFEEVLSGIAFDFSMMLVIGRHVFSHRSVGIGASVALMEGNTPMPVIDFDGISGINDLHLFANIFVWDAVKVPVPAKLNVIVLLHFVAYSVFDFEGRGRKRQQSWAFQGVEQRLTAFIAALLERQRVVGE